MVIADRGLEPSCSTRRLSRPPSKAPSQTSTKTRSNRGTARPPCASTGPAFTAFSETAAPSIWTSWTSHAYRAGSFRKATAAATIVTHIVREASVVRRVKGLHNSTCQVCGTRLEGNAGPYAEAAHIQPFGRPHGGPDVLANFLCLCPTHHGLFDFWAIAIAADYSVIASGGPLTAHPKPESVRSTCITTATTMGSMQAQPSSKTEAKSSDQVRGTQWQEGAAAWCRWPAPSPDAGAGFRTGATRGTQELNRTRELRTGCYRREKLIA